MSESSPPNEERKLSADQYQNLHALTRGQLASYECHKIVRAARIKEVRFGYDSLRDRNTTLLIPEDQRLAPIEVSKEFVAKHDPQAPGYFVVYPESDGYESWSPVAAFEKGYALKDEAQPPNVQALLAD